MFHLDFLHDLLFESRQKWKDIKYWKSYLSMFQLGVAEFLRWLCLLALYLGILMTGIGSAGVALSETFIEVRAWKFSDGSVRYERNDGCANLTWAISVAIFLTGVGLVIAHCVLYLCAILFWMLSFLYLFRTDMEFELHHATTIGHLNTKINQIESQVPMAPRDAAYMAAFDADNARKIASLRAQILDVKRQREKERAKREKAAASACCTGSASTQQGVPTAVPILDTAADFEESFRAGIDKYLLIVETTAVELKVNEYSLAERQALPQKITNLMQQENMTEQEVVARLRRTIYADFSEDLNEVRLSSRREARIRIRMSVNRVLRGDATQEDNELIDHLKNLSAAA